MTTWFRHLIDPNPQETSHEAVYPFPFRPDAGWRHCRGPGRGRGAARAATLPSISSAALTFHLDANQLNAADPGDGNVLVNWNELVKNVPMTVQGLPHWQASAINGMAAVRFAGGNDMVTADAPEIASVQAQTIFVVASMAENGATLSGLIAADGDIGSIRQELTEVPQYFAGNAGDFHTGGAFRINGTGRLDIPGGFNAPHVVKAVSPTTTTMNSLAIGSYVGTRNWAGDVAEVLAFDGVLNGNDLAQVNKYLTDKYGLVQVVDEPILDTSIVANAPFGAQPVRSIGVDFNYGNVGAAPAFKGIHFDDVRMDTLDGSGNGNFVLNANSETAGTTLSVSFPVQGDNTTRGITATATGDDASAINALTNSMFYLGGGDYHPSATMVFGNLPALTDVYVQAFGGHQGWTGDLSVSINGAPALAATWNTVTTDATNLASVYGFYAQTDAAGQLSLTFAVANGLSHAAIGGMILHVVPEPSSAVLFGGCAMAFAAFRRRRSACPVRV